MLAKVREFLDLKLSYFQNLIIQFLNRSMYDNMYE